MARQKRSKSRGEVNEVISQLERLSAKDGRKPEVIQSKRECFQKLIRYMTQGIDMSAAFVPATKCVALSKSDLPLKKMLYLYLRTAARQNTEVALLVVQALLNDCKDADPTIRGLAVRSMASLRVPELIENAFQAVEAGLKDQHPYVREAAVMGVLKCFHQDPTASRLRGLLESIRQLLSTDTDPQVVADALYVAKELRALPGDGGTLPDRATIVSLLNHIRAFSDWAQCFVLDMVAQYHPDTEEERFDILEMLDFGLNHPNSAVVMATARVFLQYTLNHPDQHNRALRALRDPMQTLAQGREPEIAFATLSNFLVLVRRSPQAFDGDLYADFFSRSEDPSYLKALKIEILVALATPNNAHDIADELTQYARDKDEAIIRAAVRGLAAVAAKAPGAHGILDRLLLFLDTSDASAVDRPIAASEAITQMAAVLRRFPDAAEACVDAVSTSVDFASLSQGAMKNATARAAYVWVLGEFGERVQDAPYVLESIITDNYDEEESTEVRSAIITATAKLFFKRPPECKKALGMVLTKGVKDVDALVRDGAQLYYRLLASDLEAAKAVVAAPPPTPDQLAGMLSSSLGNSSTALLMSAEAQDRIFDELNSLSVIYGAPASTFLEPKDAEVADMEDMGVGSGVEGDDDDLLSLDVVVGGGGGGGDDTPRSVSTKGTTSVDHASSTKVSNEQQMLASLLDLDVDYSQGPTPPSQQTSASDLFEMGKGTGTGIGGDIQHTSSSLEISDMFDLLSGGGGGGGGSVQPPPPPVVAVAVPLPLPAAAASGADITLVAQPDHQVSQQEFQQAWMSSNNAVSMTTLTFDQSLDGGALSGVESNNFKGFIAHVGQANIHSFATPSQVGALPYRFLFWAETSPSTSSQGGGAGGGNNSKRVYVQVTVTREIASGVVKSEDGVLAGHVKEMLETLLMSL